MTPLPLVCRARCSQSAAASVPVSAKPSSAASAISSTRRSFWSIARRATVKRVTTTSASTRELSVTASLRPRSRGASMRTTSARRSSSLGSSRSACEARSSVGSGGSGPGPAALRARPGPRSRLKRVLADKVGMSPSLALTGKLGSSRTYSTSRSTRLGGSRCAAI